MALSFVVPTLPLPAGIVGTAGAAIPPADDVAVAGIDSTGTFSGATVAATSTVGEAGEAHTP